MPLGVPKVPYRLPGEPYTQWIDILQPVVPGADYFFGSGN
jgi:hypothetical protein